MRNGIVKNGTGESADKFTNKSLLMKPCMRFAIRSNTLRWLFDFGESYLIHVGLIFNLILVDQSLPYLKIQLLKS